MIKRRQGNHIRERTYWSQTRELRLMVLTHNIMILWCGILFYRAISHSKMTWRSLSQLPSSGPILRYAEVNLVGGGRGLGGREAVRVK